MVAAGSVGGTTAPEQAILPNMSTLGAGACRWVEDTLLTTVITQRRAMVVVVCRNCFNVPAGKSTDWTVRSAWV